MSAVRTPLDRAPSVVVAPELGFAALVSRLAALGWCVDDSAREPLIDGEPEWAVFTHARDARAGRRLHYLFEPVASLRTIAVVAPDAFALTAALVDALPVVDMARARSFLRSSNVRDQWLGLLCAQRLQDVRLRPHVTGLLSHGDPRLADAARETLAALPADDDGDATQPSPAAVLAAWGDWLKEQRRHPQTAVLFRLLPDVELRRQVLRWTMRDLAIQTDAAERLARTALADEDPEVRVTGMLFAARCGLRRLARDVRDARIPESTSEGAPPGDRLYFRRMQRLCAQHLALPADADIGEKARARHGRFLTALRGEADVHDDETLLWHALTTPLGLEAADRNDAGAVDAAPDLVIEGHPLALCRVDAVRHWVGGLAGTGPDVLEAPVRAVRPSRPFDISTHCIDGALAALLFGEDATPPAADDPPAPWLGTEAQARQLLLHLAERAAASGRAVRLPTADELEMAARGPDGRFFPWGVAVRPPRGGGLREAPSPWGVVMDASQGEWAVGEDGRWIIVGGGPCARRRSVPPGTPAAVRVVLATES